MDSTSLGRLCVEKGLISEKDLERCLAIQKSGPKWRRLGEILLSEGLLTGTALANLLRIQHSMRGGNRGRAEVVPEPPSTELGWLLQEARAAQAMALLLMRGRPPVLRHAGRLEMQAGAPLLEDQLRAMLADALPATVLARVERHGFADDVVEVAGAGRVRATLYRETGGLAASLRPIQPPAPDLAALDLPPATRDLARARSGLSLVAGGALSGRTTTLAALLESVNQTRACHIVTIEQPGEVLLEPKRGRISRFEIGADAPDAAAAVDSALRADADVIALGSTDDAASILAALQAAEAGRVVLGVMTAPSAPAAVARLLDAFPQRRHASGRALVAAFLRGVVAQRLLPAAEGKGAHLAAELLLGTPQVSALVRENRLLQLQAAIFNGRADGMVAMDDSILKLCRRGRVGFEAALQHAQDAERLHEALGGKRETVHAGD